MGGKGEEGKGKEKEKLSIHTKLIIIKETL